MIAALRVALALLTPPQTPAPVARHPGVQIIARGDTPRTGVTNDIGQDPAHEVVQRDNL